MITMTTLPTQPIPRQLLAIARDIKLSHTVFALPFALLGMFLAAGGSDRLPHAGEVGLILLCMVTARTFAMSFNRLVDRRIDAQNLRTAGRALPSGRVGSDVMTMVVLACAGLFIASTAGFLAYGNTWPMLLATPVLVVLGGYSFTKRFTWLCHAVLGVALAISPVAAAIAIQPSCLAGPTVWLLSAMVLFWVAGFDILYALQDTQADQELGLYSVPSRLGVNRALWISRAMHGFSAASLIGAAIFSDQLGLWFKVAAGAVILLLIFEHAMVAGGKTKRLNMAFFTVNGVISLMLGGSGIVDVVRGM